METGNQAIVPEVRNPRIKHYALFIIILLGVIAFLYYEFTNGIPNTLMCTGNGLFACENNGIGTINGNGTINMYIGQGIANQLSDVSIACSNSFPTSSEFIYYGNLPYSTPGGAGGKRGSTMQFIRNMQCYNNGTAINVKSGAPLMTSLWIQYSNSTAPTGSSISLLGVVKETG